MRKIKFRGHNGAKWLYSESIWFNEFPTLDDTMVHMCDTEDENQDELNIETWDSVCYLGQYTGLKDKNGKEIYEGDILKTNDFYECGELIFKGRIFRVEPLNYYIESSICFNYQDAEIIGNIYENKDLLK